MNRVLPSLLLAVSMAFVAAAHATGGTSPPPAPKPQPVMPNLNAAKSSSTSGAAAKAGAEAAAASRATGGAANLQSDIAVENSNPSQASLNDNSEYHARAWSLFLPQSVFTPPMPRPEVPQGCPAPTESQEALEVVKGLAFSKASSLRDNSPCVAIRYSQILWDRCQYQKADRILAMGMKKFAKEVGEDWDAQADPNIPNYTLAECGVLKQNMVRVEQPPVLMIPPAAPKKAEPPKNDVAKPRKVPPCPAGEVLICKKAF